MVISTSTIFMALGVILFGFIAYAGFKGNSEQHGKEPEKKSESNTTDASKK